MDPNSPQHNHIAEFVPRKGDLMRTKIIQATLQSLGSDGVMRLGYERLCKVTGLSRSHINYYFPSLEALIEECFKYVIAFGQEHRSAAFTQPDQMRRRSLLIYIDATLAWFHTHPSHMSVLTLFAHLSNSDPHCRDLYEVVKRSAEARIGQFLKEFKPQMKPEARHAKAVSLRNYLMGELLDRHSCPRDESFENFSKRVHRHIKNFI
jgi:AcrR family transcriptional regulator